MFFWWICGGESVLRILLLRHLGSSSSHWLLLTSISTVLRHLVCGSDSGMESWVGLAPEELSWASYHCPKLSRTRNPTYDQLCRVFQMTQKMVKSLPAMRETRVRSMSQEDPLEKEIATHSSILAWRIPQTGEPVRLQSMGSQRVRHEWATEQLL